MTEFIGQALPGIALTVVLLIANAFFVATEFALISSRRDRLEAIAQQKPRRARTVMDATQNLSLMLAACQFGITIASILLGKVAEPAIARLIELIVGKDLIPAQALHPVSFVIAMIIIVTLHILVGEMIPKNMALAIPERMSLWLTPPHLLFVRATKPIIGFCNVTANALLKLMGVEPKDELETSVSTAELTVMMAESKEQGLIDDETVDRLQRALTIETRPVSEVMIPLEKACCITAAEGTIEFADVRELVREHGFSRYPVRNQHGFIAGYIHIKDYLQLLSADDIDTEEHVNATSLIRDLATVGENVDLETALATMRTTGSHMGKVTDRFGTCVGIVALEDMLEEYVGIAVDNTHRGQAT